MIISSPSFQDEESVPQKYTCDGGDINPELQIQNVPSGAKSLALILDDPDAPGGMFTHWTVWNIDPKTAVIKEDSVPPGLPAGAGTKAGSTEGMTSFGRVGYGGPCPPHGKPHRYFFKLYALDAVLMLPPGAPVQALRDEIAKHRLEEAEFTGIYGR